MKTVINEYVEHKKFGLGVIIGDEAENITVEFDSQTGNKIFQFPDAFELYLEFVDKSLQEECLKSVKAKKQLIVDEKEIKQLEHERQEEERKKEELEQKKKDRKIANIKKPNVVKQTVKKTRIPSESKLLKENEDD